MRIIMTTKDQDTLETFVTTLTTLVAELAAGSPVTPAGLDFTSANVLLATVQADVDALNPLPVTNRRVVAASVTSPVDAATGDYLPRPAGI
jgi:hypothetical protein